MARVSLELFKAHTRTTSINRDDEYLQHILDAAESFVLNLTGFSKEEWDSVPDDDFPKELCHVMLIVGADMYAERELTVSASYQLRPWAWGMVKPWQKMKGGSLSEKLMAKYAGKEAEG